MPEFRALSLFLACAPALAQDCPQYLAPDAGEPNVRFGDSVAVEGDTLLVAVPLASLAAPFAGMVVAYERDPVTGGWIEDQRLTVDDAALGDVLGRGEGGTALVLQGNTFFVGAPRKDGAAADTGAVYVFERSVPGGAWVQADRFESSSPAQGQRFGRRLAVDGEWLFVGSVAGNDVFQFDADTRDWVEQQQLLTGPIDVSGDIAIRGIPTLNQARVYRFSTDTGLWTPSDLLNGPPGASFGTTVAVEGNRLVIGEPRNSTNANQAGAAHVYQRVALGQWELDFVLLPLVPIENARLGSSVGLSGGRIVVGPSPDSDFAPVHVYEYGFPTGSWVETGTISSSFTSAGAQFGESIAIDGDTIAIGARDDDAFEGLGGAVYVASRARIDCNGNGLSDACEIEAGTAEDLDRDGLIDDCEGLGEPYCNGLLNGPGASTSLAAFGIPRVDAGPIRVVASELPANQSGLLICGRDANQAMLPGTQGALCIGGALGRFPVQNSGSAGLIETQVDLTALPLSPPVAAMTGETWRFQMWYRAAPPAIPSNLSPAVRVTFE